MKFKNALMLMTGLLFLLILACTSPPAEPMIDTAKVKEDISAISSTWE